MRNSNAYPVLSRFSKELRKILGSKSLKLIRIDIKLLAFMLTNIFSRISSIEYLSDKNTPDQRSHTLPTSFEFDQENFPVIHDMTQVEGLAVLSKPGFQHTAIKFNQLICDH